MILYPSLTGDGRAYALGIQNQSYLDIFRLAVSISATKAGISSGKSVINNGISTIPCHTDRNWQEMLCRRNAEAQHG
ncbi:MAG: hypothetical protein PHD48_00165 [Alphaproteobacteria bacterium]|nr:hypothetical protein [Alphaproteobacteria bacterium]